MFTYAAFPNAEKAVPLPPPIPTIGTASAIYSRAMVIWAPPSGAVGPSAGFQFGCSLTVFRLRVSNNTVDAITNAINFDQR